MRPFARACAGFLVKTNGSVAIIFGLASLAIVLMIGIGIDYGQISVSQSRLQADADLAVLAAVSAQNGASSLTTSAMEAQAISRFEALAEQNGVTITSANASASTSSGNSVTLTYAGTIPSTFGQIAGLHTYSISGTASATGAGVQYIDIYLLVDISGSMGIGATSADQTIMENAKSIGCAFGCHAMGTDAKARRAGATLRIDVVKSAIEQILSQAESSATSNNQVIRFSLFTFATDVNEVVPITSDYASVLSAVQNLQLAGLAAGTSTANALDTLNNNITQIGNGGSSASPLVYVLLATDGVGDAAENVAPAEAEDFQVASNFVPPYELNNVGGSFPHDVPVQSPDPYEDFELEGTDPSWCQPLKDRGVTMMTLEMPYVVPAAAGQSGNTGSSWDTRLNYIQNTLLPLLPSQLASCASGSQYAAVATEPSDITNGMTQLFNAALSGSSRISK